MVLQVLYIFFQQITSFKIEIFKNKPLFTFIIVQKPLLDVL